MCLGARRSEPSQASPLAAAYHQYPTDKLVIKLTQTKYDVKRRCHSVLGSLSDTSKGGDVYEEFPRLAGTRLAQNNLNYVKIA